MIKNRNRKFAMWGTIVLAFCVCHFFVAHEIGLLAYVIPIFGAIYTYAFAYFGEREAIKKQQKNRAKAEAKAKSV